MFPEDAWIETSAADYVELLVYANLDDERNHGNGTNKFPFLKKSHATQTCKLISQ